MDILVWLGLLGVSLLVLLAEQVRVMRMSPEKRARLLQRRGSGRGAGSQDPRSYLRRFIASMVALAIVGALIVAMVGISTGPHATRNTLSAAAIVLVVLAVFCVIGWMNYRRIAEDTRSPFAPSSDGDSPW